MPPIMKSQITFLALGEKCGPAVHRRAVVGSRDPVAVEHRAERHPGETHPEIGQKCPSCVA